MNIVIDCLRTLIVGFVISLATDAVWIRVRPRESHIIVLLGILTIHFSAVITLMELCHISGLELVLGFVFFICSTNIQGIVSEVMRRIKYDLIV